MMTSGGLEILSCVDVGNVSPLGTGVCLERGDAGCPPTVLQTQSLGWSWMHNPPPQLPAFHPSLLPTDRSNVSKYPQQLSGSMTP